MRDFQLYVIIDGEVCGKKDLFEVAYQAILGGADIIQLRDKKRTDRELINVGYKLKDIAHRGRVLFIINDRADIAKAVGADGVHLGQDDIPINVARLIIGNDKIIGISTHELPQAIQAEKEGADYIGVGPVFSTFSKPDYPPVGFELIRGVKKSIRIPFVAVGGINQVNVTGILEAGAKRIAVTRAVICEEDVAEAARKLKSVIMSLDILPNTK